MLLVLPWVLAALVAAIAGVAWFLVDPERMRPDPRHVEEAALAFWLVGACFLVIDRAGISAFGFDSTLIRLATVHFHTAGLVLPMAGAAAWRARPSRLLELGVGVLVVGIPMTALGFFGLGAVNWAGAMLVIGGAVAVAAGHLHVARTAGDLGTPSRLLLALAGGSLLLAMPFAAGYATARLVGAPGPSIVLLIATHGTLNALGFAIPAMVGWWWIARPPVLASRPTVEAWR